MAEKKTNTATKRTWEECLAILNAPVPPSALKKIDKKAGGSLTDINVGYAIHRMNEAFGAGNWKYSCSIVDSQIVRVSQPKKDWNTGVVDMDDKGDEFLFTVEGRIDIPGHGATVGPMFNSHKKGDPSDAIKSAQTGVFMQLLKYMGFAKEIYMGLFSNQVMNYTAPIPAPINLDDLIMEIEAAESQQALKVIYQQNPLFSNDADFVAALSKRKAKFPKPQPAATA